MRDLGDTIMFQDAIWKGNKVIISPIEHSPDLEAPAISWGIARYNYFGEEFIGMLLASIPLSEVTESISSLNRLTEN